MVNNKNAPGVVSHRLNLREESALIQAHGPDRALDGPYLVIIA